MLHVIEMLIAAEEQTRLAPMCVNECGFSSAKQRADIMLVKIVMFRLIRNHQVSKTENFASIYHQLLDQQTNIT